MHFHIKKVIMQFALTNTNIINSTLSDQWLTTCDGLDFPADMLDGDPICGFRADHCTNQCLDPRLSACVLWQEGHW